MYEITRANRWSYFVTLTFDPKKIDSTDYDLLSCKTSKWLNNLKSRYAPDLKYILVPELHKDGKKFHFHALIANTGNLQLSFSGKVAVGKRIYDYHRKPFGTKIYNLSNWKYGFSTATAVSDSSRVASYITKYITKDLCTLTKGKKRYWVSKNVDRAEISYMTLAYEDIQTIIQNNLSSVGHMSTCRVSDAGLEVMFIEINGGVLI
ncbi:rolling circle replication-associated protein [Lactonifactor longoviformis]|uniref:rolling circle replication-associated protein n=1 Tax=Lactonifactor longoviformis TaxID=341220 RepID=UPI001D024392|nr:hypothetical protein [Lactonifactor longoviformis]MCB5712133.1 hypothetical protein [Lactonifactor longoviformis]MCB5716177.1 hypothetical protein [Lactonifactor longoviformis]